LRYLFFAERTAAKAFKGSTAPRLVDEVAVVGAGTMGASIASALLVAGYRTTLIDTSGQALNRARDTIRKNTRRDDLAETVVLSADLSAVASADLVIDAVFEDLDVKKTLLRALDGLAAPDAILASNTSYLNLDDIGAVVTDPTRVAGLHFFNPAHRNRLVEIVETAKTSCAALATLAAVARRLDKVAIRAQVGEGFVANRIYSAYRAQCEYLVEDGCRPDQIDRALVDFGYAMGPFAVADMSGLDIAWARRKRLAARGHA
jgi:3-hydroxyacyl-CoA dehydrogenase